MPPDGGAQEDLGAVMPTKKQPLTWYQLRWGPTMEKIGVVLAASPSKARRKAPKKYRKFLGEIDAEPVKK